MAEYLPERRTTLRLMAYWEKQRGDRLMPREQDIHREDIEDLWDCCFIIRVEPENADYNYSYLGQAIIDAYSFGSTADVKSMAAPDGHRLAGSYGRVLASRRPFLEDGEFRNLRNERVRFRECLLPLGDDDDIKYILGGMCFRIIPAKVTA